MTSTSEDAKRFLDALIAYAAPVIGEPKADEFGAKVRARLERADRMEADIALLKTSAVFWREKTRLVLTSKEMEDARNELDAALTNEGNAG